MEPATLLRVKTQPFNVNHTEYASRARVHLLLCFIFRLQYRINPSRPDSDSLFRISIQPAIFIFSTTAGATFFSFSVLSLFPFSRFLVDHFLSLSATFFPTKSCTLAGHRERPTMFSRLRTGSSRGTTRVQVGKPTPSPLWPRRLLRSQRNTASWRVSGSITRCYTRVRRLHIRPE